MSWFGLDFDNDGNVDFIEHMFSMDIMGGDEDNKRSTIGDDIGNELECAELQDHIDSLEDSKSDLDDALFNLEMNEPDVLSPAYDSWAARRDALQEQIDQIDSAISDLQDSY